MWLTPAASILCAPFPQPGKGWTRLKCVRYGQPLPNYILGKTFHPQGKPHSAQREPLCFKLQRTCCPFCHMQLWLFGHESTFWLLLENQRQSLEVLAKYCRGGSSLPFSIFVASSWAPLSMLLWHLDPTLSHIWQIVVTNLMPNCGIIILFSLSQLHQLSYHLTG